MGKSRAYRPGGIIIQPEIGLPPGYEPPSAALGSMTMRNIEEEVKRAQAGLTAPPEPDPRWEWVEVTPNPWSPRQWVKGACRHQETVPVESIVTGELLARLCLTCDAQLPLPDPYGIWMTTEPI